MSALEVETHFYHTWGLRLREVESGYPARSAVEAGGVLQFLTQVQPASFVDSRIAPPRDDASENPVASPMPLRVFSEIRAPSV